MFLTPSCRNGLLGNQAIVQVDRVQVQSWNSGYDGRNIRRSYVQEEVMILLVKHDEEGVIITDEQNDLLFADASRIEEIEELSANICLMAKIQPTKSDSVARPSYDYAFLSEIQTPSTSYVNPLFAKDKQEQKYPKQPKIINNTIGDDQIDSNIIFDEPNEDVNSGSVEYDNNVQESYKLEQLARNAFKEAEKQQIIAKKIQQQNTVLTKQLESYNKKLSAVELKRKTVELQKTQTILKRKMSENEDKYHDNVLDLEVRAKKNEDVVLKIGNSLQGMFMLGPKLMSFYDSNVKHGLGDTEDILDDTTKSQIKMKNKLKDPIAIEKKQNVCTIDYKKLNALYEDFVPQEEFSANKIYFLSSFISSENPSNASSPSSLFETKPTMALMPSTNPMKLDLNKMRDSIEIQEGMQNRINILENDVQRCQKQSLDFELQLQHEKERQKCESSLKNVYETSWISKMEKLESENVSLEFQVQYLIKERENVKSEYQKLFDSIKKIQTQTQGEINELIEHVNQKTYAYAEVRAYNQDLLITISELKAKLKKVEKGKSVNTKFDKNNVSNQLLCVTPLNKQVFQKKTVAPKIEEKHVLSKTVTLQTSPNKKKDVETNQNVITLGMYKVTNKQEPNTKRAKSVLPSAGLSTASNVRRPLNRDSPLKNSVLSNTKKSSEKVDVSVRTNKKTCVASKNVVLNKKIVTDVDV
ncbi:hypothetical protein Tco_0015461 [Tanacetum coccineum]